MNLCEIGSFCDTYKNIQYARTVVHVPTISSLVHVAKGKRKMIQYFKYTYVFFYLCTNAFELTPLDSSHSSNLSTLLSPRSNFNT